MLTAIRHGDTQFNKGKERLRGWLPIPLSKEGMQHAMDTAKYLKKISLVDSSKPILTSDLPRAVQTAHEIAGELGTNIEPRSELRDWNVGIYTGKSADETLSQVHHYIDNPDKKIPEGESYNEYYNRIFPLIKSLTESSDMNTIISHNRTMTLIHALTRSKGSAPSINDLKQKGPVEPGGLMVISPEWDTIFSDKFGKSYV